MLLKNYISSSKQCFSRAGKRLSGSISTDGKVRRILMTPVFLTWDWEFLNMPMFNLILMLPNLTKLLLVAFFFQWLSTEISCLWVFSRSWLLQMYNSLLIFVQTALYNFWNVLGTWTKAGVLHHQSRSLKAGTLLLIGQWELLQLQPDHPHVYFLHAALMLLAQHCWRILLEGRGRGRLRPLYAFPWTWC